MKSIAINEDDLLEIILQELYTEKRLVSEMPPEAETRRNIYDVFVPMDDKTGYTVRILEEITTFDDEPDDPLEEVFICSDDDGNGNIICEITNKEDF